MKLSRIVCSLLACVVVANCQTVSVHASTFSAENIVWQENMEWEWIDYTAVAYLDDGVMPMTSSPANGQYPKQSIRAITQWIDFNANHLVTFNCSYSPSSASIDFGVIASNGRFYYINVKEGSINQAIRISQSGSYQIAIRNNSSQTVRVVGFVDY